MNKRKNGKFSELKLRKKQIAYMMKLYINLNDVDNDKSDFYRLSINFYFFLLLKINRFELSNFLKI
jgi:hypothetical protein